jgi:hypothetical protein
MCGYDGRRLMSACTLDIVIDGSDEALRPIVGRVRVRPTAAVRCKELTVALLYCASGPRVTCVQRRKVADLVRDESWGAPREYAFEFAPQSESWSHDSHGYRALWQLDARATLDSGEEVVASTPLHQLPPGESARLAVKCERPAERAWAEQRTSVAFLVLVCLVILGCAAIAYFGHVHANVAVRVAGALGAFLVAIYFAVLLRARRWETTIGRPQVVVESASEQAYRRAAERGLRCTIWLVERAPIASVECTLTVRWRQRFKPRQARASVRDVECIALENGALAERTAPDEWQATLPLPTLAEVPAAFRLRDSSANTKWTEVGAEWRLRLDVTLKDGRTIDTDRVLLTRLVEASGDVHVRSHKKARAVPLPDTAR